MGYYPILLRVNGKAVLVVGGGKVAERKVLSLLDAGASVEVVARELTPLLQDYVLGFRINYLGKEFRPEHLEGKQLVVVATDDRVLNEKISRLADERGILVNVVDMPELCSFIVPSLIRRGDLILAISSGGKSPAFSKFLRQEIEKSLPPGIGKFLEFMGKVRERLLAMGLGHGYNKGVFESLVRSRLLEAMSRGDKRGAVHELEKALPEDLDRAVLYEELFKVMGKRS